jgi:hypothetical protein
VEVPVPPPVPVVMLVLTRAMVFATDVAGSRDRGDGANRVHHLARLHPPDHRPGQGGKRERES